MEKFFHKLLQFVLKQQEARYKKLTKKLTAQIKTGSSKPFFMAQMS